MLEKSYLTLVFDHIIVHPSDWHKLGFVWDDLFYIYLCLPFGLSSAPQIVDLFSHALQYMAIKNGTSPWTSSYLDDTITLELGFLRRKNSIEIFKNTARDAGWEIQESNAQTPIMKLNIWM